MESSPIGTPPVLKRGERPMIRRIKKSFILKWLIFTILLATLPISIVAFTTIQTFKEDLKESIIERERGRVIFLIERIEDFFEALTKTLLFITEDKNFMKKGFTHAKNHLEDILYMSDYFYELTLINGKGKEILKVSYELVKPSDLKDQLKTEMFQTASKGQPYYGDFFLTRDMTPSMVIALPLRGERGRTVGVLSAKVKLKHLWTLISQTQIGTRGNTCLIDQKGRLVAHSESMRVLDPFKLESPPLLHQASGGKEGFLELVDEKGEKFLCLSKSIRNLGWKVIIQIPSKEAFQTVNQVVQRAIQSVLITLLVGLIFSLYLSRRLIFPIKQLSSEMGKVSRGDLDVHIHAQHEDEIGVLTESFNQMIRDLRQSQEALRESEEKFRRIFQNLKDMVYITSTDGKFIEVNQAGVEMLGYENKGELKQIRSGDVYLNPEERRRFKEEISKEGFIKDFETRLKKKDGTPIDVLITASVKRNDSGEIIGYEGIIKNISDRKRMEEELKQRAEEFQTLYDLSALINESLELDRILSVSLEKILTLVGFDMGTIHLLNEDREKIELRFSKGVSPELMEQIRVFKIGEGICGKAVQAMKPIVVPIEEYPTPRVVPFLKREGYQMSVGIPIIAKGRTIGAITMASRFESSIGEKTLHLLESIGNQIGLAIENANLFSNVAKAKSEWETTFDAVTDLITVRDKDYRIIRANRSAFKRYGLKPEEMIGKRCFETLHQSNRQCEGCYITETLRTKKPISGERYSKYLNGIFKYYTFPVYDESGEIVAVIDLAREVTEEKRLETEKEVVNNINRILASSLDIRRVIRGVHKELRRVLDSSRMTITFLDEKGEGFRYLAIEKDDEATELMGGVIYPIEGTLLTKVLETGQPVIVDDTGESESFVDQELLKEGIRSSLVYPLEYKGKVFGTLNFGSKEVNHFSDHHLHFLRLIAPALAISIQNALLFEETIKRLNELTVLYEIIKISVSSIHLNQILKDVIHSLSRFLKFERMGILMVDEKTKRLVPHPASYDSIPVEEIEKLGLSVGRGITGWVAETGEPLLVNDVTKDSRYLCGDEGIRSEICVPLKVGQKVIGVIDGQRKELNAFTEDDLRLLSIVGGQLATVIDNLRLYDEIKQSEEKYRTVIEGAHDGICIIGLDNRLRYANHRMVEIFGYSEEELVGIDFYHLIDEESRQYIEKRTVQRQRGEKLSPIFELNGVRKDGEVRNLEINAKVLKDSAGKILFIVFVRDITDKKRIEEQLLQSEKLRALGEMASGVAHDFNNALAAILGNAQLMLITVKDEELKESLRTIEKVAKDAAHTVRRLQEFTRKKTHQELYRLDVNSIIKDAIEITKPKWKDEAQARGIPIEIVMNFGEIPPVSGHASDLREVITNMIFNAIEAMPEGGKIEIRTFQQHQKVHIQISDTGIGMEEEVKKKLFEPFFTTKPFTNSGLGLSMSYGIIKRFGGDIEVESKVGWGTTFTISLPIQVEGKEEEVYPISIQKGREARILVIDDEEEVRDTLSKILSKGHHQVMVAQDGKEGIRLFKENKFDLVLTDLGMPGLSGWEVCRAIKRLSPQTPVGMITGWGVQLTQEEIEVNHLDFLIPKPFDFHQIIKLVNDAMASKGDPLYA